MKENILDLCRLPAVSGDEKEVRDYLKDKFKKEGLPVVSDKLGSIFGVLEGPLKKRLMLSANMDESGGMITGITPKGYLSFLTIGPYPKETFVNQAVRVLTRQHQVFKGFVFLEGQDYLIDIGFDNIEALSKAGIKTGEMFVLDSEIHFENQQFFGKNLNNRASLGLILSIFERLIQEQVPCDIYLGGITQSVVGNRAAITATNLVKPDLALVLDASYVPNASPNTIYVRYFDKTLIPNKTLLESFKQVAQAKGYEVQGQTQVEGTDGSFIHKTGIGVPTLVVALPLKHPTSFLNRLALSDLLNLKDVLETFILGLDTKTFEVCAFEDVK